MRAFWIFQTLMILVLTGHVLSVKALASTEDALTNATLESFRTSSVKVLPNGIAVGEFDARAWNGPYNGLYLSRDLGETWEQIGLAARGITDIDFDSNMLFISTYYKVDEELGLFISQDRGQTFYHSGLNFSSSQIESDANTVYLGGYSHGLWVSQDNGVNWEQKIGDGSGWTGPHITSIKANNGSVFASTPTKIYRSLDHGSSWDEVPDLAGIQTSSFFIQGSVILAGTNNDKGLYRSMDNGLSWHQVESWQGYSVGEMSGFKDTIYAQRIDHLNQTYYIFASSDHGTTWYNTMLNPAQKINSMDLLFSYPVLMFISTQSDGLYKYDINGYSMQETPFLRVPWEYELESELVDKITAYFDHQLPLLGYSHYPEPSSYQDTVVNFLGFSQDIYANYYSSHNGVDFALQQGEQVLASASGLASYYYCSWCGHSIVIDHQNGYQTIYMHLQKDGLITSDQNNNIWLERGDVLGKVGMSGRTSGPHLHFGVLYDKNSNGVFDDYPDGLVDPFSWFDPYDQDPWAGHSWIDEVGNHTGSSSQYLWEYPMPIQRAYISPSDQTITMENKTFEFDLDDFDNNLFTATIASFIKPYIPVSQINLEYVEDTSISITGVDHYENKIISLDGSLTITVDLTDLDLENVVVESLKMYVWDVTLKKWEPLPTVIDHVNQTMTADTDHLSHFAVMGEKLYPDPPVTTLTVEGESADSWFSEYPLISMTARDHSGLGIRSIYFSINDGVDWDSYNESFYIDTDGITTFMYRAEDLAGNLETTREQIIKVDTIGSRKDKIRIINAHYAIL